MQNKPSIWHPVTHIKSNMTVIINMSILSTTGSFLVDLFCVKGHKCQLEISYIINIYKYMNMHQSKTAKVPLKVFTTGTARSSTFRAWIAILSRQGPKICNWMSFGEFRFTSFKAEMFKIKSLNYSCIWTKRNSVNCKTNHKIPA